MGNFCSGGGKKSPKNERRESAESLPYGQEACSEPPPGVSKDSEKQQQQKSKESLKKRKNNDEKPDEQGEQLTATQQQQASSKSTMIMPVATASSSITTTANAQIHNDDNIIVDTQLGLVQQQEKSQSSNTANEILEPHNTITTTANISAPSPDPGGSLSPIPTASTPSPYSTSRYSSLSCRDGSGGAGGPQQSYQNISPILGHIDLSQYAEPIRASSYVKLFHLRCDIFTDDNYVRDQLGLEDFYLIAISTESDEITVWNIYEQKPTRILKGIPRPRNVHMVDQYRTVVLCNRELMLYDLNHAKLLTKLKGVMNQKMPFYGLHNNKYVVALSRNRMYVNMINLDTGDLETTFKAGEDRFLNSLLTSANGKICVCGDETQKPFPLLVWDLSNRKLLYDLRIPHHEFITKLSAISDDGHYVVSVCQECNTSSTNFLIVYDLQSGTLFKKWKPEHDSVSVAISTQCGGCVINGIKNNDVLVWDISTGNIKYTLSGHTAPPDLLNPAPKSNVFLSYNSSRQDTQLRIWSLENGNCLWIFTPDKEISCCTLTPNGKCIIYGYVGEKKLNLAVNDKDLDKSHDQFLEEMRSKIIPYGDKELDGHEIDLNS